MTAAANDTARAAAAPGREGFRQAMSWVHTWAGLVLGWLLFAIFATGTLSFFKSEFNLWMRPEMHGLAAPSPDVADRAQAALHRHAPGVTQWFMRLPDERLPAVTVLWRDSANGRFQTLLMDPATGESIGTRETMGGEFFYRFHFEAAHGAPEPLGAAGALDRGGGDAADVHRAAHGRGHAPAHLQGFLHLPAHQGRPARLAGRAQRLRRAGAALLPRHHLQRADDLPHALHARRHRGRLRDARGHRFAGLFR